MRSPALPVASPCWLSRRLALPLASPCWPSRRPTARAPHCWQPRRPALLARRLALPALSRPAARTALLQAALLAGDLLPACRPAGSRTAAHTALPAPPCSCPPCCAPPCWQMPCCPRAALLAAALLCPAHAPPCWPPPCPAVALPRPGRTPPFPSWPSDPVRYMARRLTAVPTERFYRQRFIVRLAERAHFGQHKTAKAMYDPVVARYSSPATAALGRLILPYLFPELSAFARVEDLITHLRTSDTRYRAALPAEFLDRNPPPMDHFLALDPTDLTVDLLEKHLLAAKTSVVAVGAARGISCTPFFEGGSPSPLAPSYAFAAAVDLLGAEDVGAASTLSGKRRSSKGKVARVVAVAAGVVVVEAVEVAEVVAAVGVVVRVGALVAAVVAAVGVGGGGGGVSGGSGGGRGGGVQWGGSGGGQRQQQQERRSETPSPQQLCEWFVQRGASGGNVQCTYVIRIGDRAGQICGKFHTQHRCFSRLDDAWRAEFGDEVERPRWLELLRSGVDIFALDYDAILAAMYALSVSAEGDCYQCVPPDPGIEVAALGASESALPSTTPAEALHTFILDLGASEFFFRDSTTLTLLPAPVRVRLADPSGGPVLARSSTVLPCPAVPSGSLSGLHLPFFSTNL
ncbi:unnamed protein product, partial [Closterium sp. NIES-53]